MNPEQLAKSGTEHAEQMALFCWVNMARNFGFKVADDMEAYRDLKTFLDNRTMAEQMPVPELQWLHAIPNAGARGNKVAASQLKAEGVKAGVADCFLPVKRQYSQIGHNYVHSGLYIEMKRANGRPSDVTKEQTDFMLFVESQGFIWNVAFGWRMAADMLERYLECR